MTEIQGVDFNALFIGMPIMMFALTVIYHIDAARKYEDWLYRHMRSKKRQEEAIRCGLICPDCKQRFSDWFVWSGHRYCYPCHLKSGYQTVIMENGKRLEDVS